MDGFVFTISDFFWLKTQFLAVARGPINRENNFFVFVLRSNFYYGKKLQVLHFLLIFEN
jgi:hypothetical protein